MLLFLLIFFVLSLDAKRIPHSRRKGEDERKRRNLDLHGKSSLKLIFLKEQKLQQLLALTIIQMLPNICQKNANLSLFFSFLLHSFFFIIIIQTQPCRQAQRLQNYI